MNELCAHCGTRIERDRYQEILCYKCEQGWWASVAELYAIRLQEYFDRTNMEDRRARLNNTPAQSR